MTRIYECSCKEPGFCPVFNRLMGTDPPDWKWCQTTNIEERTKYYDLLSKESLSPIAKINKGFRESGYDSKWFNFYCLTQNDQVHYCETAYKNQDQINKKIIEYIENQNQTKTTFENVEILCLGHSNKQFETIQDRPYLKKVNLNDIDAGKYSDNQWAEARGFLSQKPLFSDTAQFVGFTTASWNVKYEPYNLIDDFHNWDNAKVLINSKPEDNIVLCADIFCCCNWFRSIFYGFFDHGKTIGKILIKTIGLENYRHIKVPFSNQMIAHKSVYEKYRKFLYDNDIMDKVDWVISKLSPKYLHGDGTSIIKEKYQNNRIRAFCMEAVCCFWFSHQDYIYLPNVTRRPNWYNHNNIKRRIKEWGN